MGSSSVIPWSIDKSNILRKVILFDMLDYIHMVYSTYMNRKKIGSVVLLFVLILLPFTKVKAASPTFSFYPNGGIVADLEEGFTVDVLIDSAGMDISKASMTISFDPSVLQLRKAMRNETLFDQWPDDESSTNNKDGLVMLTGYTASDSGFGYYSATSSDVFARLEFDVIDKEAKEITLSSEYSGSVSLFQSYILGSGSIESNLLSSQPASVTFSLDEDTIPETAIDMNVLGVVLGILLILVGAYVRGSGRITLKKKKGTIVLYE
jgi:hypothetical protein